MTAQELYKYEETGDRIVKRTFVPREKLGKKQRKALDGKKRLVWEFSPVSRRVESKKAYDRKKAENGSRMSDDDMRDP